MKFLVQRVDEASVTVEGQTIGRIGKGFLVLVGISAEDTRDTADKMIKKLIGLRIFDDENGKTNLDIRAHALLHSIKAQILVISQFTLYADCRRGNRPSFINAGAPEMANVLYQYIVRECRREIEVVEEGSFGAEMKVSLINDGPFTILLDSAEICHSREQ